MTTIYPSNIDNSSTLPSAIDGSTSVKAESVNLLRDTVIVIEQTLGVDPQGSSSTIRNRLDELEQVIITLSGGGSAFTASQDLSGTSISQTVIGLQGRSVSNIAPSDGYILTWLASTSKWTPESAPVGFSAGKDLSGTATLQTVIAIQGNAIESGTLGPAQDGYVLAWKNSASQWQPTTSSAVISLSGDVTGTTVGNTVVSLTGAAGLVNIPSTTSLEFGAHATSAQSGLLRIGNINNAVDILKCRNAYNTSDLNVVNTTGSAGTIHLNIGNNQFIETTITGGEVVLNISSGSLSYSSTGMTTGSVSGAFIFDSDASLTSWQFNLNGVDQLGISSGLINVPAGNAIEFGAHSTAAQYSGIMRLGDINSSTQILTCRNGLYDTTFLQIMGSGVGWGIGNYSLATAYITASSTVSLLNSFGSFSYSSAGITTVLNTPGVFTFDSDTSLTSWKYNINGAQVLNMATSGITIGTTTGTNTLTGGLSLTKIIVTSSSRTLDTTTTDCLVFVNYAGACAITLPTPTAGRKLSIKDSSGSAGTNNITISHHSSEHIDGSNTFIINTNYGGIDLISDGTNWFSIQPPGSSPQQIQYLGLPLFAGLMSTTATSSQKSIIGACYFTAAPAGTKVYFECIVQTSSPSTNVNIDLYDVAGISNSSVPTVLSGSVCAYGTDSTLHHFKVEVTPLESVSGPGIIQTELYSDSSLVSVTCYMARIVFQ
jgi:hypothetical protein